MRSKRKQSTNSQSRHVVTILKRFLGAFMGLFAGLLIVVPY